MPSPPLTTVAGKVVGTWKLRTVMYEDQETKERSPVYGAHPIGYQLATPRGRWIAVMTAEGRKVPQNDDERALALRSMIAYTGRYRVKTRRIMVEFEAAWQRSRWAPNRSANSASKATTSFTSKARRCRTQIC